MTVLTKPSLTFKKTVLVCDDPEYGDEKVIEITSSVPPPNGPPRGPPSKSKLRRQTAGILLFIACSMFLLVALGLLTALQIYQQATSDLVHNRFHGFCTIPMPRDLAMLEQRQMPLRWKSTPSTGRVDPEVQVVSLLDEDPEHLLDLLREVLDINLDDSVEKISVLNNGHPVSFVHDFDSNVTGIIDDERCFMMELDPELVLQPQLFAMGLQRGDSFDVSRVRTNLKAMLPAIRDTANRSKGFNSKCADKPTYELQKETEIIIRKRSVDAPPHDFMHFSGKRIQEIEISNLADVLAYEQAHARRA